MPPLGGPELDMLEAYTGLGFCAGVTSRIKLGTMATGIVYRHPGILLKTVTTLDVLSGGRAYLGIGAAWYEQEAKGLGVPFPPLAERFEWLEETLQVVRQMWSTDDGPFDGKHYQLAETLNSPQPLRQPHPPIMIGGGGEKKTLRLVARYGDACNVFAGSGPAEVEHKLAVLREWCEVEGRPYDEIRRTVLYNGPVGQDAAGGAAFVEEMRALADVGVQEVHVMPLQGDPVAFVRSLGEHVVPELSAL
jgi:F420-dependent oxidoreductase-like protein